MPSRRRALLAVLLAVVGAVVLALIEAGFGLVQAAMYLHGRFGIGYDASVESVGFQMAGVLFTKYLALGVAFTWPLAAWCMPFVVSIGGLVAIAAANHVLALSRKAIDVPDLEIGLFVLGLALVLFLRIVEWADRRWNGAHP
ncbi:MAG TPA: hypothetical protein VGB91_11775 [Rhizomicrobium sp.]